MCLDVAAQVWQASSWGRRPQGLQAILPLREHKKSWHLKNEALLLLFWASSVCYPFFHSREGQKLTLKIQVFQICFQSLGFKKQQKRKGGKKDVRDGDSDCSILLYQALLQKSRQSPPVRRQLWSESGVILHSHNFVLWHDCTCNAPRCHVALQVPQVHPWGSPVLKTSCPFLWNWYPLPFANRKVNAIPWLKRCHFFP